MQVPLRWVIWGMIIFVVVATITPSLLWANSSSMVTMASGEELASFMHLPMFDATAANNTKMTREEGGGCLTNNQSTTPAVSDDNDSKDSESLSIIRDQWTKGRHQKNPSVEIIKVWKSLPEDIRSALVEIETSSSTVDGANEVKRKGVDSSLEGLSNEKSNKTTAASTPQNHVFPDMNAKPVLPKVLAVYFPQFHNEPLNNRLWGEGFTDWVNLKEAPRLNRRGYKIIRPTEFGYYDLTNTTVRKQQGELAKAYGVDGFVYHHYWFYDESHPGPTLQAPLEGMLRDGHPNISFSLNWVAENWTSTWHRRTEDSAATQRQPRVKPKKAGPSGSPIEVDEQILQRQFFPDDDAKIVQHYQWLRQFFHHKNYIQVEGKPLFMVYRAHPALPRIIRRLKSLAVEDGFPGLHVTLGQYASHNILLPKHASRWQNETLEGDHAGAFDRLTNYPFPYTWMRPGKGQHPMRAPDWCRDRTQRPGKRQQPPQQQQLRDDSLVGIATSFDNTPRRDFDKARLWIGRDGEYGVLSRWLENLEGAFYYHACCFANGGKDQFLLVNAWNEWAEGMALEPSDVYGRTFLEVLKFAKTERFQTCMNSGNVGLPENIHVAEPSSV